MSRFVPGTGNPNAPMLILGEAPGQEEDNEGAPFVGKSGQLLDTVLEACDISRGNVWLTNVYHHRPPNNDISRWDELGLGPETKQFEITTKEIESVAPNVIVALGNTAMKFATGQIGIQKYRGSVMPSVIRPFKVVPTFHPAHVLYPHGQHEVYEYWQKYVIQLDFQKAIKQSLFKEYRKPNLILQVAKNSLDVYHYFNTYRNSEYSSIDIEVFKSSPICIGIAMSRTHAISIPLVRVWRIPYKQNKTIKYFDVQVSTVPHGDMANIWKLVADHLANPRYKKIGQNFKFDQERLEAMGFGVNNFYADTMLLSHTLCPEFPKSLAFLCSIYTDYVYYKDEGKEFNPKRDKIERLLQYNAMDAVTTLNVFLEQLTELTEAA